MDNIKNQTVKVELTLHELVTLGVMVDEELKKVKKDVYAKEHYEQLNKKLCLI
tara:strand:+ start:51 stop:209 length:159 start_codon:yes stop_codon:yes gene_type:complete